MDVSGATIFLLCLVYCTILSISLCVIFCVCTVTVFKKESKTNKTVVPPFTQEGSLGCAFVQYVMRNVHFDQFSVVILA